MNLKITRLQDKSSNTGTFGYMAIDGADFCCTCEQPWDDNKPDVSCIPPGDYDLQPYDSPKHGPTVVFHNPALGIYGTPEQIPAGATGRSLCEIHIGNYPSDVEGCVAVGREIIDGSEKGRMVTHSAETFASLRQKWGDRKRMTATIAWDTPA